MVTAVVMAVVTVSAVVSLVAVGQTEDEAAWMFAAALVSFLAGLRGLEEYSNDDETCRRVRAWLGASP